MLEEQQVKGFNLHSPRHTIQGPEAVGIFKRHSRTLRRIDIGFYCFVEYEILCSILEVCEVLEHFSVKPTHDGRLSPSCPSLSSTWTSLSLGRGHAQVCVTWRSLSVSLSYPRHSPRSGTVLQQDVSNKYAIDRGTRILQDTRGIVSTDRFTDPAHASQAEGVCVEQPRLVS